MTEPYLFYSSLTLISMGCFTLGLCVLFRFKLHRLNSLSKEFSATIFDRTFNVFDPHPKRRKLIHKFLAVLPVIIVVSCIFLVPIALAKVFESGFFLSTILVIVCLNLMLLEIASETYQNATTFIEACNNEADLGRGDLKVFRVLKSAMPRLSNYYLALTILFLTLAATSNHAYSIILSLLFQFIGSILEVSMVVGFMNSQLAVLLFFIVVTIVMFIIWKIKSRFFNYLLGA